MELPELATARRAGFPLLLVIVNNGAYGGMKRDQMRHHGGRIIGTELALPNFPDLAAALGLSGRRVPEPAELPEVLREAAAQPGPALVDVACPVEGM